MSSTCQVYFRQICNVIVNVHVRTGGGLSLGAGLAVLGGALLVVVLAVLGASWFSRRRRH